ncbi:hypothetical protein HY025_01325 [Candidatus Daviesbacteria bacterium]|nr:hypothetical protein [Candidatus Daviesbacteria bacterium]
MVGEQKPSRPDLEQLKPTTSSLFNPLREKITSSVETAKAYGIHKMVILGILGAAAGIIAYKGAKFTFREIENKIAEIRLGNIDRD